MKMLLPLVGALAVAGSAARAQELRKFCGDRPGLGTPACTVDEGHLQVEAGLADWTRDVQPDARTDTLLGPDLSLRLGIGQTTELRLRWTSVGTVRTRDRMDGAVDHVTGPGDVTLGVKQNLRDPEGGHGLSVALLPQLTVPVGRAPVGAATWGAGLLVPVDYSLSDKVQLQLTPEVDAAPDEAGGGRHLQYGSVVGIDWEFVEHLKVDVEFQAIRDRDPSGHETEELAGLSFSYRPRPRMRIDLGSAYGLDHAAPDVEVYAGISQKF